MTIEARVFRRMRFEPDAMPACGFRRVGDGWRLTEAFLDGAFTAVVTVTEQGEVSGQVVDRMNDEIYAPLRSERYQGPYVNSVRAAYEALLLRIAGACCREVPFVSDQANRLADLILARYGVRPDFPWEKEPYRGCGAFRHPDTGKWFALIMRIRQGLLRKDTDERPVDVVNLKADPAGRTAPSEELGIYPAYHMNHRTWISVTLDDRQGDEAILALVDASFRLT